MITFLPDQTRLSQIRLRTGALERALEFYCGALGLKVVRRTGSDAVLDAPGRNPGLLAISEERDAGRRSPGGDALGHFAIRYGRQQELDGALRRLGQRRYPLAGASDPGALRAVYLADPDGNGVQLCADRPHAGRLCHVGQVKEKTGTLDASSRLSETDDESASTEKPLQVHIGHIHFRVTDLSAAEGFYGQFLGLAVTQCSCPGVLSFSAASNHPQIAVSVQKDETVRASAGLGLSAYRFEVPCAEILYCLGQRAPLLGYETRTAREPDGGPILQIRDLNGNWLEVQAVPASGASSRCSSRWRAADLRCAREL